LTLAASAGSSTGAYALVMSRHALLAATGNEKIRTDWSGAATPSIGDEPRSDAVGSDHRPVVADFDL
jgi:hypothetical protein